MGLHITLNFKDFKSRLKMAPVLILLAKYNCPGCMAFEPEWAKLCQDNQLTSKFWYREFHIGHGSDGTYTLPSQFSNIGTVPTLLLADYATYNKYIDLKTGNVLDGNVMPTQVYTGEMTYGDVKTWLMSQR